MEGHKVPVVKSETLADKVEVTNVPNKLGYPNASVSTALLDPIRERNPALDNVPSNIGEVAKREPDQKGETALVKTFLRRLRRGRKHAPDEDATSLAQGQARYQEDQVDAMLVSIQQTTGTPQDGETESKKPEVRPKPKKSEHVVDVVQYTMPEPSVSTANSLERIRTVAEKDSVMDQMATSMDEDQTSDLIEQENRKNWRDLLDTISCKTSLDSICKTTKSGTLIGNLMQRTSKEQYKRKMTLLKINYEYRLKLIKQLKHDLKTNFRSQAQQLSSDYNNSKNNQYKPNLGTLQLSHSLMKL